MRSKPSGALMRFFLFSCLLAEGLCFVVSAEEPAPPPKAADARPAGPAPLKALFITGGGYHDYKALAPLLTGKIAEIARVEWEVKWGVETLGAPTLGEGFDAVVYDLCFDAPAKPEDVENALRVTREGKPTVFIHCSVHSFTKTAGGRAGWIDCCGEESQRHDPSQAFGTEKLDKDSPITKAWPEDWTTPGDELYQTLAFGTRSHALLKAKSPHDGREHIVCWTSEYGKGRVFATTLGHDLKTAAQPAYHRLLANGVLWACGKLGEDGRPTRGYEVAKKQPDESEEVK